MSVDGGPLNDSSTLQRPGPRPNPPQACYMTRLSTMPTGSLAYLPKHPTSLYCTAIRKASPEVRSSSRPYLPTTHHVLVDAALASIKLTPTLRTHCFLRRSRADSLMIRIQNPRYSSSALASSACVCRGSKPISSRAPASTANSSPIHHHMGYRRLEKQWGRGNKSY